MPIISAGVQEALRQSGIVKEKDQDDSDVNSILDQEGLSLRETVQNLSDISKGADTSSARLRANEIALKLRGTLREAAPTPPVFNIVIQDSGSENTINGIDRILIPRQEVLQ
jgi:hypothetical protein